MKVTGEHKGKKDEMLLEDVEKEQSRRLDIKYTEGPLQKKGKQTRVPKQLRQIYTGNSCY